MKILFLLISSIVFSQSKDNCVKESMIKDSYYIKGNYLVKGYSHGDISFNIEVDYVNSNSDSIVFFVYEINGVNTKKPLIGVNCDMICDFNGKQDKFKIKRNLSTSNENGKLILNLDVNKMNFFSINYPGFKPVIIDYEKLVSCSK